MTGSRESFNAIDEMIKKLDNEDVLAASEFQIFYLKKATAALLQPVLTQLFAQRPARDGVKDPVSIIADARTNAILMAATPEDMKLGQSLIQRLDAEPDRPGTTLRPFPLVKADATAVKTMIDNLNKTTGTAGAAAAAAAPSVVSSVDERTNTVWVSAGEGDMARIADMIQQADTDTVPQVTEIRVFPLKNADATELAQILNDTLNKKPTALTTTSPNRQALITFVSHTPEGQKLISSGLQTGLLINPDKRANALVVSAPTENMALMESLIASLDSTLPAAAEIRVVALENADARQTATVLLQLFKVQAATATTGGGAGGTANQKTAVEYKLKAPDGGDAAVPPVMTGTAEEVTLAITVDVRTNSLLIGGTKRYVDMAEKVALDLDASTETERLTQVFRPKNAQAADIQTAVTNFLNQEKTILTAALGTGFGTSQYILDRQVAIVAEPQTNTLLVSASPRYFDVVSQMIEELDQPPPQVLIQVLLAEVTLNDTDNMGIDWNFHHTFDGHPLTVASNNGTQGLFSTTSSGGVSLAATPQGFSVAATGGDISMFMQALESTSHVETLSRPQILASDNQAANINIGQKVPFVTNSQLTDSGTTNVTVQYQQVGIILSVTPRIHPDGSVKLVINPEVSSLSSSNVAISTGVNAIIVNTLSATTTVTVQDGHTVVLGGLITTNDQTTESKVPFLGDLPILGPLFKATQKVKERTELLIILTPTVIRNVAEADTETHGQTQRLNLLRQLKHDSLQKSVFKPLDAVNVNKSATYEGEVPPPPAPPAAAEQDTDFPAAIPAPPKGGK